MADANRGLILWTLTGAGVFLLYSAYKNVSPSSLLANHLNGGTNTTPIVPPTPASTATDSQGKTWNTSPDNGNGYVTTDPPLPGDPSGVSGSVSGPLAGYHTAPDLNGVQNVVDQNGLIVAQVPGVYQKSPETYIPRVTNA